MKSDIEIAQSIELRPIEEIAGTIDIDKNTLIPYGGYMAKVPHELLQTLSDKRDGNLIIVTGITPTKYGEGKTTTSIGLSQALWKLGKKAIVTLREPSLGPCMGVKGGGTGGGYSQVLPMDEINLHFTGDAHAVNSAHNLLSAVIDSHIHNGNELSLDVRRISWPRTIDMNDRALRNIVVGLGGKVNGFPREDHFVISPASEVMAIAALVLNLSELKKRLGEIIVGQDIKGRFVKAKELNVSGAMTVLMRNAINPNLVQTVEHTPAFVHGGPFANIAHGTNSIIATKLALKLSDFVVTETGFGADLGAEKFFDVVSKYGDFKPKSVVLVASTRALRSHSKSDAPRRALEEGLENLGKQIENVKLFHLPVVVALNRFSQDTDEDCKVVESYVKEKGARFAVSECWEKGGEGAIDLAKQVIESVEKDEADMKPLYDWNAPILEKVDALMKLYNANGVEYSSKALNKIRLYEKRGYGNLPIMMAKTQMSLSDDPKKKGVPKDYTFKITDASLSAGAGFVVLYAGNVMTMPGLSKHPAAMDIDIDEKGKVTGLF